MAIDSGAGLRATGPIVGWSCIVVVGCGYGYLFDFVGMKGGIGYGATIAGSRHVAGATRYVCHDRTTIYMSRMFTGCHLIGRRCVEAMAPFAG
jgi:hypothetical protein